jgi:hypothetical protein
VNYGTLFNVTLPLSTPIPPESIAKVTLVRLAAVTHWFDQNQRYLSLDFFVNPRVPLTLSVTAPANANLAPPGYYMLFLVSNAGAPSKSVYVKVQ